MTGYYVRRWSRSAIWCARLATIAVPYFAIALLLHRFGQITTPQVFWLIAFGLLLILASLFMGVRAFLDLWNHGDRGGRQTIRGVILSVVLLIPFAWFGYQAVRHPLISDVATNPYDPPQFVTAQDRRAAGAGDGMNALASYDEPYAELLVAAYPKVASRRYNAGAERVFVAVRQLMTTRKWEITAVTGAPGEDSASGEQEGADAQTGETAKPDAERQLESAAPLDIRVEAVAYSFFFRFPADVVVRVVTEQELTLVDMRVSVRWGAHDFGTSAALIRSFLGNLDAALLGIAGEG